MTDNTSRTLTDDPTEQREQRELHTEDLVASGRPDPAVESAASPPTAASPTAGTQT